MLKEKMAGMDKHIQVKNKSHELIIKIKEKQLYKSEVNLETNEYQGRIQKARKISGGHQ